MNRKVLLHSWENKVQRCTLCNICNFSSHKVTYEIIGDNPNIFFLGEAPGDIEYAEKQPFIGPAGNIFRDILEEAIPDESYIIVNSVLCVPYLDDSMMKYRTPSNTEIQNCYPHVEKLIRIIKPSKFIAVGKIAEKSYKYMGIKEYLHIMHPSAINKSGKDYAYHYENTIMELRKYVSE